MAFVADKVALRQGIVAFVADKVALVRALWHLRLTKWHWEGYCG